MNYRKLGNEDIDFMAVITYHNYTMIELHHQLLADLESGNEKRALHIVYELLDTKYVKYAFKLLKRYAAREIGSNNPVAFILVKSLSEAWEKDKAVKAHGGEADRHYLAMAVQYLARATKNSDTKDLNKQVNRERCNRVYFEIDETVREQVEVYKVRKLNEATNEC